jgi:hypothetical protein
MAIAGCVFLAVLSGNYVVSGRLYVTLISSMNKLISATVSLTIIYFEENTLFRSLAFGLTLVVTEQGTLQPII